MVRASVLRAHESLTRSVLAVQAGQRAVMFNRISGVSELYKEEGMHFRVPWLEWPIIYDIKTRPRNIQSLTGSRGRIIYLFSEDDRSASLICILLRFRFADGECHSSCVVTA